MSIYRRKGQKVWSYDFWLSNRRFSGSTDTANKKHAKCVLEEKKKDALRVIDQEEAAPNSSSSRMTVEIAASRYWREVGQHLANRADCFTDIGRIERQLGKKTFLYTIGDETVADLVAQRRAEGVANATVNRTVLEPLRALLRRARRTWKQTVQDIEWKDHHLKEPQERVREASVDEEAKLVGAIRADYAPALRFAIMTGCRKAEIVGLAWDKVDFFNRQFRVTGKGDKTRTIPMTRAIYDLLWSLKDHHSTAVFTYVALRSRDGHCKGQRYPVTYNGLGTEWRRSRARSGVTDFRLQDTRHTAATRLVRATGNLKMAQKLLGHTEIGTTSRYSHVTNDDLRAGMEATDPTRGPTREAGATWKSRENDGN
ncbi:site-specific integrase [Mesorhizobium sp. B2-4-17]|uniref:tyrosine-type recombinase/integrase n=1 Tax=Mesorhizobium sp. B2-4-17 TaxID=2589932 RepID=UPI0015E39E6A|nr:site-specific integrase [Mesorhizobium sp. B2-4-17]